MKQLKKKKKERKKIKAEKRERRSYTNKAIEEKKTKTIKEKQRLSKER